MKHLHRILTSALCFASLVSASVVAQNASTTKPKDPVTLKYIEQYAPLAKEQERIYKIPACITLAQGILESASGTSRLAVEANNHFGIKCHNNWEGERFYKDDDQKNDCFRVYSSVEESFKDHSVFLKKKRYADLFELDINDYKGWAKGLKTAGYATNPKYPELLIELIERYELTNLDNIEPLLANQEPQTSNNEIVKQNKTSSKQNGVSAKQNGVLSERNAVSFEQNAVSKNRRKSLAELVSERAKEKHKENPSKGKRMTLVEKLSKQ